ncbi:FUSC family protein [Actinomadura gamaensis]|uniref:Aromatic acid exporter family protein n=1 Tax=Actinomadura gamaensis TaxID=1763541 RepID=A0ABV9TZL5_9ACTN
MLKAQWHAFLVSGWARLSHRPPEQWRERAQLIVKAVVAAVLAWLAARFLVGHRQPYFAPLAALLGVYPTVARSFRESFAYAASFVVAALLALGVGAFAGPGPLGIAAVVSVGLTISDARWFAAQGSQIPFIALFALLIGGEDVLGYVEPRMSDVAVGLAVGLAVNALILPPLHLGTAYRALRELQGEIVAALGALAGALDDDATLPDGWDRRERRLLDAQGDARRAQLRGEASLRFNPRVALRRYRRREVLTSRTSGRLLTCLEQAAVHVHAIASTLRDAESADAGSALSDGHLRGTYAEHLRCVSELIEQLPAPARPEEFDKCLARQDELEAPHQRAGTDVPGIWDPRQELLRFSRSLLDDVRPLVEEE